MTATSEMRGKLRKVWEQAERVALLRHTGQPTALSAAITCRHDAILSVELSFSALRHENERLKALVEKLDMEASND